MNSTSFDSLVSYLSSHGIISSKDNTSLLLSSINNAHGSHKAFIISLAQMIKSKANQSSSQLLSLAIYNEYISNDNLALIRTFKRMMTLYQRNQRRRLMECYNKWRVFLLGMRNDMSDRCYDHFDFTITKGSVHDRLYNYQKTKETNRRLLENEINASEAQNCTFIPLVNHYYTLNRAKSNKNNLSSTNTIDAYCQGNGNGNTTNNNQVNTNGNQLYYLSTNPNTSRITNKSVANTCMTSSNHKSASSKNIINIKRHSKAINATTNNPSKANIMMLMMNNNNGLNTEAKKYLSNQSSYNNLIIPNQNAYIVNNGSSKNSKVNILSNITSTKPKTPKYSIGEYAKEGSNRESIGRLSKDFSVESLAIKNSKRNNKNLSLNGFDNSNSLYLQDKRTNCVSNENFKTTKKVMINPYQSNQCTSTSNFKEFITTPLLINKQSNTNTNSNKIDKIQYLNKSGKEYSSNNNNTNHTSSFNYNHSGINSNSNSNSYGLIMPSNTLGAFNKNIVANNNSNKNSNNNSKLNDPLGSNMNLKISKGVVSEYVGANKQIDSNNNMNTIYTNQITLQTISDSKLYDIANHYITTDESLDKYSCFSCSYRKYNHKKK